MQSVWTESVKDIPRDDAKELRGEIRTDVLIIGGGLAGLLCAYKLKEAGVNCILAEAKQIGGGVTCNTTGKITAQHRLIYSELIKKNGSEQAGLFYESNAKAIEEYRRLSKIIECDFEEKTAYVFSTKGRGKLEKEADAYHTLGITAHFAESVPLPFMTAGALGMEGQAQFNALKFLLGISRGLDVYENTFVTDIVRDTAVTDHGRIRAENIILATHFPLVNIPGAYFMKMYQHRSYVIGLEGGPDMGGMFIDEQEDGYSFRNSKDILLLGGGSHGTGKKGAGFEGIRQLAGEVYPEAKEKYAWSTQDCMTLDGIPYIGIHRKSRQNLYVATGFNKWGMTGSMVSAMLLTDLITKGSSKYEGLFSPQRSMLHPQLFLNTLNSAAGLLSFGKRCPHMGCALKWNAAQRSWDCPCHGSRFDEKGNLINNPAKRGISVE